LSKQERRIKKELEKLWRKGRYWDWLALVEKENLHRDHAREEQEAWMSLVKKALRLPANLQEFWAHLPSVKRYPTLPDFQCLRLLGDFVSGKEVRGELAALRNLTFPAESLRQKALSWKDEFFREEKIRDLFSTFLHHPGKVSSKDYQNLSSLAEGTSLGAEVAALGAKFDGVRGLNRKTGGRKRLGAEKLRKVTEADRVLKEASKVLAPQLQEILFYPFLFQVHSFFRQGAEKEAAPVLLRVASSMPFMFLKAAGEKGREFQKHLLGAGSTLSDLDRSYLAKIPGASLEEKAALVNRMRSLVQKGAREEHCEEFRKLYQGLLADLAAHRESLPERERRELGRVMSSSILRDLPSLWTDPDDLGQLMDLLKPMAAIGLGNGKIAVLGLILAEKFRDPDLKKEAQDSLKDQAGPTEEDILWFLNSFPELFSPEVGSLKPLVEVGGTDAAFIPALVERVREEIEIFLITHAAGRRAQGPFAFLSELTAEDFKAVFTTWRRELATLKVYPPFFPLQEYLACFPEGYFTQKGFQRYLGLRYERKKGLDWFIPELEKNRMQSLLGKQFLEDSLLPLPIEGILRDRERALFLFLEERFEGLKTANLDTLGKLTELLLARKPTVTEGNLLIRISNLLGERLSEGDNRAHALREKIMRRLIHEKSRLGRRRPR
jgi:hypothetical protein